MRKLLVLPLLVVAFLTPLAEAKEFLAARPSGEEIIRAILNASRATQARPALLYGLLGQETGYGSNLGKTEASWSSFCATRNTGDCRNWENYDCKPNYTNARHYDEILKDIGFVDSRGNTDRSGIPISSTCAMGFTQFEPNTWWQVIRGRGLPLSNLSPWNIGDAVLMSGYYLEELGADATEALGPGDVLGKRDKIALQRYYCGAYYSRLECVAYASGVLGKARTAPVELLGEGLFLQLRRLEEERNRIRGQLKLQPQPFSEPRAVAPPPPRRERAAFGPVTVKGRVIDRFSRQPIINALPKEPAPTSGYGLMPSGEFLMRAEGQLAPGEILSLFPFNIQCYVGVGNLQIRRNEDGSLSGGLYIFHPGFEEKTFAVDRPEIDLGDIEVWPGVDIRFVSDVPVKLEIEYLDLLMRKTTTTEFHKTYDTIGALIPLNYDLRVNVIDQAGTVHRAPAMRLGLDHGCSPVELRFTNGQFRWMK